MRSAKVQLAVALNELIAPVFIQSNFYSLACLIFLIELKKYLDIVFNDPLILLVEREAFLPSLF